MKKAPGVVVCRVCPMHLGHEALFRAMFDECGMGNSLIIIGSSNTPISLRHFFSYAERKEFVLNVFPEARLVGLPDYQSDKDWLLALDDLLCVAGVEPKEALYFGGCQEDIRFFEADGRNFKIINRFDGTTVKTSATEVRDALIGGRSLDGLVSPALAVSIWEVFNKKWEEFKKI